MPENKRMKLKDSRYKVINHNHVERRGVAIIHRSRYHATTLLSQFNDGHLLVVKINANPENLIIVALYAPPNYAEHRAICTRFTNVITHLKERYATFSLLVFTDFNKDLRSSENQRYVQELGKLGLTIHLDENPTAHTRSQMNGSREVTSYLDYFFSLNVRTDKFSINKEVGSSDHKTLRIEVLATSPVTVSRELKINYKKIRQSAPYIIEQIMRYDNSTSENVRLSLDNLVIQLRNQCPMQRNSPKSLFVEIQEVEKEILAGRRDFDKINRLISKSSRTNYYRFLDLLEILRMSGKAKEYYAKLAYLQRSDCTYPFIEVLEDPSGGEDMIVDPRSIKKLLSDKYRQLFSRGVPKRNYFNSVTDELPTFSYTEIYFALAKISNGKAVSHDLIPDNILEAKTDARFVQGMTAIMNSMMASQQIPRYLGTGRLFVLNKKPEKTPNLDSLRPINIISVVLKVLEAVVLAHLKSFLIEKRYLHTAQLGFRANLSTSMNIIKFIGTCKDLQNEKLRTGYVLFIDLKAAFDSVDHQILFCKLQNNGLDPQILSVIKLLYSSMYTSIDYDSETIPINQGVLQGSLISPYLFNIYINDLLSDLEEQKILTLAYADDISCICETKEKLDIAIDTISTWCEANKIALNASKSGFFRILSKRGATPTVVTTLREIPKVQNYKYLGVTIGCDIRLTEHVSILRERCKKSGNLFGKLVSSQISCQTRIEIWQTFTKSFLLYGLETAPLSKNNWIAIERLYLKTLKQAVRCPSTVPTNMLLYITDQWSPTMLMAYRVLAVRRRYHDHFSEDFPLCVRNWLDTIGSEHALNLQLLLTLPKIEVKKALWIADRRRILHQIGGGAVVDLISGRHGFLRVGDKRDDFIVKYFVGISGALGHIKDRKLVFENCPACRTIGTQKHFVNECPKYAVQRRTLRMALIDVLRKLGLNFTEELIDLHSFIKLYLYDERLAHYRKHLHSFVKEYLYTISFDVYDTLKSL